MSRYPNKYQGTCEQCGGIVPANAGYLRFKKIGHRDRPIVLHRSCSYEYNVDVYLENYDKKEVPTNGTN